MYLPLIIGVTTFGVIWLEVTAVFAPWIGVVEGLPRTDWACFGDDINGGTAACTAAGLAAAPAGGGKSYF